MTETMMLLRKETEAERRHINMVMERARRKQNKAIKSAKGGKK